MKLLIFPGAGDPHSAEYSKVYRLIQKKSKSYGYSEVDTSVRWPGQLLSCPDTTDSLNFESAVAVAKSTLAVFDASGKSYDILARSFGTAVALSATMGGKHPKLRRIILWGVSPHWKTWEFFVQDIKSTMLTAQKKGVRIDQNIYAACQPIESLLLKSTLKVIVTAGTLDIYSSREFNDYLSTLLQSKSNVTFRPLVQDAPHEVTGDLPDHVVQNFCDTVLG